MAALFQGGMPVGIKSAAKRLKKDIWDYKTGIALFALYYITVHILFHAFCPSVLLTGLPCAGCGMTRAVFFLLTGRFRRSWQLNPMALPVLLFVVYCLFTRYFLGKKVRGFKAGAAVLGVCMLAVYGYRMYAVFPDRPPYVYTAGNFLEKHVPFYRDILRKMLGI